jgi:hypothetical protein
LSPQEHSAPQPAFRQLIQQASLSGCQQLILSSEEFIVAYRKGVDALVEQTSDTDLHIILTLSPIGRRAISLWQERVKHRFQVPLDQAGKILLSGPGLASDLTKFLVARFPTSRVSVIITNHTAPSDLYRLFSCATGVPLSTPDTAKAMVRNQSLGRVEAEVMRGFNVGLTSTELANDKYRKGRSLLRGLFNSEEWQANVPRVPLVLPTSWIEPLRVRCAETICQLRELESCGQITVFGNVDGLDDLSSDINVEPIDNTL